MAWNNESSISPLDVATWGVDLSNNIVSALYNGWQARKSREWQEEMWNKQNEYNLPVNQVKRLQDAGINPITAFGSASSAMGTSTPGSPSTPTARFDLGDLYLRQKQVRANIKAQEANIRREDQVTEQLRMNNEMMQLLFQDRYETERGDLYVQRIIQGWQEDNLRHQLDIGLQSDQVKLDALRIQNALNKARTKLTHGNISRLRQEIAHLNRKYKYEHEYYDQRMNPYENSTALGILRYLMGNAQNFIDELPEFF